MFTIKEDLLDEGTAKRLANSIQLHHLPAFSNFINIPLPTEWWQQNWQQLVHYMVTSNGHWTKLLIINLKTNQHPYIRGTTFIQHVPYNKGTRICFQVFTAVTVHIVIFWAVTVCSFVGGNQCFREALGFHLWEKSR